jgi:hypothetical protein
MFLAAAWGFNETSESRVFVAPSEVAGDQKGNLDSFTGDEFKWTLPASVGGYQSNLDRCSPQL